MTADTSRDGWFWVCLPFLLVGAAALPLLADLPWWCAGALGLPGLLWAPGAGWCSWLNRKNPQNRLGWAIDAAWIGLGIVWFDVVLIRELGLREDDMQWGFWGLALAWTLLGSALSRRQVETPSHPISSMERWGLFWVIVSLLGLSVWRWGDVSRPLQAHWYLDGATDLAEDEVAPPTWPVDEHLGFLEPEAFGWPEAGAVRLRPEEDAGEYVLKVGQQPLEQTQAGRQSGRWILAVQGPLGSRVGAKGVGATVEASPMVVPEEGPVRRYVDSGVAAIAIDVVPGERISVEVDGDQLYVMPSVDAVWALHAVGQLRFVHYYQLLNIVENQDWAAEVLDWRWFTWHQPPGWSPILAVANVWMGWDLPAGNCLFFYVLLLLGATSVRLTSVISPRTPVFIAWLPGALVASHGFLMLEPASANFPDSLYAAALLAVVLALSEGRRRVFAMMGLVAGCLRWPGIVVATIFAIAFWRLAPRRGPDSNNQWFLSAMGHLWGLTCVAGVFTLISIYVGIAGEEGRDLGFILYFETFPEHWHGDFDPRSLLGRVPHFFAIWTAYTGGALVVAVGIAIQSIVKEDHAGLAALPVAQAMRAILVGTLATSLLLATIDHHPTHYFLPLVALMGPVVAAGVSTRYRRVAQVTLSTVLGFGLWIMLWTARVW